MSNRKHTRAQIMSKRAASHAALDRRPATGSPVTKDGIYCHVFTGSQVISNSTGRPVA